MGMMRKYYIAGHVLEITADFDPEPAEEIERFRTESVGSDFQVCFAETEQLARLDSPDISADHNSRISVHQEESGIIRAFHEGICGDVFAQAYFDHENKCERICYLPQGRQQFRRMRWCFDWLGIEDVCAALETVILHAALIDAAGKGILFMGPSGVGKSTRADLWHHFAGAVIINGDRTFVNKDAEGVWNGYGSPYAGSSEYYRNRKVPVCCIVVVKRGGDEEMMLRSLSGVEAFREIYKNVTVCQCSIRAVNTVSALAVRMCSEIPIYEMICPPDIRAVQLLGKELGMNI